MFANKIFELQMKENALETSKCEQETSIVQYTHIMHWDGATKQLLSPKVFKCGTYNLMVWLSFHMVLILGRESANHFYTILYMKFIVD